jgi:hypothetical protein
MKHFLVVAVIAIVVAGCGTEEPPGNDGGVGECNTGDGLLYPLEAGAWWRFEVEEAQSGDPLCPDKLVSIGDAGPIIPERSDVIAYPARSDQPGKYGIRWQEVTADGSVRRHVDEWFNDDGSRLKIVHYCPYMTRVDDGAHACAGAAWTETWRELQVNVDDPAAGEACAGLSVNAADCAIDTDDLPEGCSIDDSPNDGVTEKVKHWQVVAIDESIPVTAGTFTTLHLLSNDEEDGDSNWYWARGVGKVRETASDENDALAEYCLPAEGCDAGVPADLDAGCE